MGNIYNDQVNHFPKVGDYYVSPHNNVYWRIWDVAAARERWELVDEALTKEVLAVYHAGGAHYPPKVNPDTYGAF